MISKNKQFKNFLKPSKLITLLILFAVIFQAVFVPFLAFAEIDPNQKKTTMTDKDVEKLLVENDCGIVEVMCWGTKLIAVLAYRIMQAASVFLWASVSVFEYSASISLQYYTYSKHGVPAVYEGWKLVRDFVNLFFIFIILVVAISVILQISQYGSKEILFRLILVAVFINFSFFITQQIITAANSAAIVFAKPLMLYVEQGKETKLKNTFLTSDFVEKLNPQKMLKSYKMPVGNEETKAFVEQQEKNRLTWMLKSMGVAAVTITALLVGWVTIPVGAAGIGLSWWLWPDKGTNMLDLLSIFITSVGGIAILLTASFVILAAAIMFMIRTIVLWVLMILAPLAFISEILPATRGYAKTWWRRLLREAFFAPAMLFMLYIASMIINGDFLEKFLLSNQDVKYSFIFYGALVSQYVFILVLLAICLIVARNLGATGANQMISYGTKMKKWAQGQAGKIPQRFAARYAAPAAEKVATSESMAARWARRIPGVGAGARGIVKFERKRVAEKEKDLSSLTTDEIKARYESKLFKTREDLMAMTNTLKGRGDLGKLGPDQLKDTYAKMKGLGMDVKDIETYMPTLAAGKLTGRARKDEIEKAVQRQRADMVKDLVKNPEAFDDPDVLESTIRNWDADHLRELVKKVAAGDAGAKHIADNIFGMYKSYGADTDKIADGLESEKNYSASKLMKTKEGADMMKPYGVEPGWYQIREEAKETTKLPIDELTRKISAGVSTKAPESSQKLTTEIIKTSDTDRLAAILERLAYTERQELALMLKSKDPKQLERILKLNPDLAASPKEEKTTLKQMSGGDINELDYAGLKSRMAAAGKNMDSLLDNMIRVFNPQQIKAIIDKGGELSTDFMDKLERIGGRGTSTGKSDKATDIGTELDLTYGRADLRRWVEGNLGRDLLNLK